MSSMDRNVQSHPRFKAKFVRDLETLYKKKKYDAYILRFKQFKQLNTPDDLLVNYYFEALMHKRLYYYVIEYALERMQQGQGDYEDNMSFMLKAMLEEERYDEVLEFTAHLMQETIPHHFRMFIREVRLDAEAKIAEYRDKRRTKITEDDTPIDVDTFFNFSTDEKLGFIGQITKEEARVHRQVVRDVLDVVNDNTLKTAMLIYLKTIEDREIIHVTKHDQVKEVIPSDLPNLEDTTLGGKVIRDVIEQVESNAPDLMSLAESLIISIMMDIYPIEPPFSARKLTNGFLSYIHESVNLPHDYNADADVTAWIKTHF